MLEAHIPLGHGSNQVPPPVVVDFIDGNTAIAVNYVINDIQ